MALRLATGNGPIRIGTARSKVLEGRRFDRATALRYLLDNSPAVLRMTSKRRLKAAFEYAAQVHEGQTRKDLTPYIIHPWEAAVFIAKYLGGKLNVVAAALLHDVIEEAIKTEKMVTYESLKRLFGKEIAYYVALLTMPKCKGPLESPTADGLKYEWVFSPSPLYNITADYFRSREEPYPPEAYEEMRNLYFRRLHSTEGVAMLINKLVDALSNLWDIDNLTDPKQQRKLRETGNILVKSAARLDWSLYEMMRNELVEWSTRRPEWGLNIPDLEDAIAAQRKQKVIICRPRELLDMEMVQGELVIRYPGSGEITVYGTAETVDVRKVFEIGLPLVDPHKRQRIIERLREQAGKISNGRISITPGRSLFGRKFTRLTGRETIYAIKGLRERRTEITERNMGRFIETLFKVQEELARAVPELEIEAA